MLVSNILIKLIFLWFLKTLNGLLHTNPKYVSLNIRPRHFIKTSSIYMAQSGGRKGGGGGGTAVDNKIKQEVKSTLKDEIEKDYRLILHDDTVHTIQQVCEILGAV